MHTEEQAKTKWCPEARLASSGSVTGASAGGGNSTLSGRVRCIASECMHWRWNGEGRGYCGLSGRP